MRFSIGALLLIVTVSSTAATTIENKIHQRLNLRHIPSWQSGNKRQFRTRNMRSLSSSGGGLLRNSDLPNHDPLKECSLQDLQTPQEADVGILSSCPTNAICVAHPESSQGGFCQYRNLQQTDLPVGTGEFCPSDSRFAALDQSCDCSAFDTTSHQGSFVCLVYAPGHCFQENLCGSLTVKQTFDDYHRTEYCYDFEVPITSTVCYYYMVKTGDVDGPKSCSIVVDGVECNACSVIDQGIDGIENGCLEVDCSNTPARVAGRDCLGGLVVDAIFQDLMAASILPTTVPTVTPSSTSGNSQSTTPPTIAPSWEFSSRLPAPTNSPTVAPPSLTTDQPSNEPKFSLTMSPGINLPRYSLTAPPVMLSTSTPTLAPTSLPSTGSTPTAAPTSTTPTLAPTPASTTPPTLIPTSAAPQVSNETRGPSEVSSITGDGSSPTSSAATSFHRRHTTSMVLPLVALVTLASLTKVLS